jgi:hypothetical protein
VDQGQFSDPDFINGTHQRENVQFANWKSLSFGYEIPPNKYVGEVCTSAKVSNTDRGIPMIFSVTTEQCTTGTANGVLMMKKQLICNSTPNLQIL